MIKGVIRVEYEASHHDGSAHRKLVDAGGVEGVASFGGLSLVTYDIGPVGTMTMPLCPECADEHALRVLVVERGGEIAGQGEARTPLAAGQLAFTDIRKQGRFHVAEGERKRLLYIPRWRVEALWPSRGALDEGALRPMAASPVLLPLLSQLAVASTEDLAGRRGEGAANAAMELLLGTIGPLGGEWDAGEARWQAVRDYVEDSLRDPGLSADAIAASVGVSTRAVYLLFQQRGDTVRGYIRRRRLARSRDELARHGSRVTVAEVAHRWGFGDQAGFSRAFRGHYGCTPSSVRAGEAVPA